MDVCGFGNRIEVTSNNAAYVKVSDGERRVFVACMIVSEETVNYADTLTVANVCSELIKEKGRKVTIKEIKEAMKHRFDAHNVFDYN